MGFLHNQETWAFAFGILGNIISVMVYLAPVPTFIRIYKKKSTESFQSLPYQVALFSSMLWLYYALLKSNAFLLITINCFGCVVETIYIALFFTYANRESRKSALKLFSGLNMGVFSTILAVTQFLVKDPENRVDVLGWVCVAVSVAVFAAPLSIVARVVRTKSVEFMPVTLSIFLTISAVMWFSYGMFIKDLCVALPNVLGFFLGMVQIVLYGIYKKKENALPSEKKPAPEKLKTVVVLGDLGVTETYPVDLEKKNCRTEHRETEKTEEVPEKCAVTAVPVPEPEPEPVAVPCAVQMVECAA